MGEDQPIVEVVATRPLLTTRQLAYLAVALAFVALFLVYRVTK